MSEQYTINIPAHPNIYFETAGRELRIDFSTPQKGIDIHTGFVILVPGFGGNIDSNVYNKMKEDFADRYNMVTIQCDYFGSSYMQGANGFTIENRQVFESIFNNVELEKINQDFSILLNLLKEKNATLSVKATLAENEEEFNDMGFMQAIDIITAVEAVKITLKENGLEFNSNRVIGYGHSHGAYLLHLCNILVPDLFSFIVDNSAWIEPLYLSSNRFLSSPVGKATLAFEFDYLAKRIIKNKSELKLDSLYENHSGSTQILAFQGNNDNLINHREKQDLIENMDHSKFILVTEKDVDNKKYKTNTHGLGADFLELFSYALEFESQKKEPIEINKDKYRIDRKGISIDVDYTYGLPLFNIMFKKRLT